MKSDKYQKRFYRNWVKAEDLHKAQITVQETDVQILADKPIDKKFVEERIRLYRRQIESYIQKDRRFLVSLKPLAVELHAPLIVKEMSEAARKANVGPMAAVAGAIARYVGKDLLRKGYKEVIVENGGDIFLKTLKTRSVGIYAGKSRLSNKLYLKIKPEDTPIGICASSGTVGHSLSFGSADTVVIVSKNASLADAAATAVANRVNSEKDLKKAMQYARSLQDIKGAVIIINNNLASFGEIEFA